MATVKTHVNRVLSKLGLRDRPRRVVLAYEAGIVRPGEGRPTARPIVCRLRTPVGRIYSVTLVTSEVPGAHEEPPPT